VNRRGFLKKLGFGAVGAAAVAVTARGAVAVDVAAAGSDKTALTVSKLDGPICGRSYTTRVVDDSIGFDKFCHVHPKPLYHIRAIDDLKTPTESQRAMYLEYYLKHWSSWKANDP